MTVLGLDLWGQVFSYLLEADYMMPYRCVFKVRLVCRLFRDAVRKRFAFAALLEKVPLCAWTCNQAQLAVDAVQGHRFFLHYKKGHSSDPFLADPKNRVLAIRSRSSTMVVMDGWTSETEFSDERVAFMLADGLVCQAHTWSATNGRTGDDEEMEIHNLPDIARAIAEDAVGSAPRETDRYDPLPSRVEIQFLCAFANDFLHRLPLSIEREEDAVYLSVLVSLSRHMAAGNGNILASYSYGTPDEIRAKSENVQTTSEARSRIMLDSRVVLQVALYYTTGYARLGSKENRVEITVHGLPFAGGSFVNLLQSEEALLYIRSHYFFDAVTTRDLVEAIMELDVNLKQVWRVLKSVDLGVWKELAPS